MVFVMNHTKVNALNEELCSLQNRINQIKCMLALIREPVDSHEDVRKDKLFSTFYKCPVCYEFQASKGRFHCKHYICTNCYKHLQQKCCPMCRALPVL